jgi:hypothetical protein
MGNYEDCFVAFLDILGFKEKVSKSRDDLAILRNIVRSLNIVNTIPSGGKKVSSGRGEERTIHMRSRFFSDCLVFFLKDNPENLAHLFLVIRFLQDQLWERDICLRGSIVRDKMYWTEDENNITVGPGLINAHHLEAKVAIYPRIVVSKELYAHIEQDEPSAFPFGDDKSVGSLVNYIEQDADGVYFLNLLHPNVIRAQGERLERYTETEYSVVWQGGSPNRHSEVLEFVGRIIRDNENFDEEVMQKYDWLQSYRSKYDGQT